MAMPLAADHNLTIRLFPERSELEGRDRIHIHGSPKGPLHLSISPRVHLLSIRIDGRDHPYTFRRGRLALSPNPNLSPLTVDLDIHYTCRFDDPAPVRPLNADNPGFGVSGTISPAGTFILAGAGWYPRLADARESFDLRVEGPADTVAVTTGRAVDIAHTGKRTVSRWQIDNPLEGLSLSAGPYVVDRRSGHGTTAATFLFPENRHLSPRYLEASLDYLKRYSDLFGAYPFDGFSVVENFFPTGYGFPAYTLIGGRVLRLPFIPHTSLPHEIVHNWWGNGVLVDSASGNWCEGLASYTADYLNKANQSSDAAMDYRRQALRNFSSLVSPESDFPLNRFRSRTDPVTKAVGYDKAAMVFHMLHQKLGDAAFWNALRDLYRQFLFQHASWQDLQKIFERQAGRPLEAFFRQWVDRPGAPQIQLKGTRQIAGDGSYRTIGRIVQEKPYYDVTIDLVVETGEGPIKQAVRLSTGQTAFDIPSRTKPRALVADPDYHLFRRLSPQEMPPTVNTLKGSSAPVAVVARRMGRFGRPLAGQLARAMGLGSIRIVDETDFDPAEAAGNDLLFIGLPAQPTLAQWLPRNLELAPGSFQAGGQRFNDSTDVLFFVARHPDHSKNIVSLIHPLSPEAAGSATVKIPHYGRYSYLAFSDGRNRIKGTWEVKRSPLMVRWETATRP
ncbi:M1 family metallopeptidase [Desulfosarcina alkanivorans]|nr:M1 family aminopeptidase [Desulfosarcina alkanivorans]